MRAMRVEGIEGCRDRDSRPPCAPNSEIRLGKFRGKLGGFLAEFGGKLRASQLGSARSLSSEVCWHKHGRIASRRSDLRPSASWSWSSAHW